MNFDFSSFSNVSEQNTTSYLKPYSINENVTIKSTAVKEGTTKDGRPWKQLVITFGNDEGIYNDSTFYLDTNDPKVTERGTVNMPNGGKRELPSRWEQTYTKLAVIARTFAPDLIVKFNENVGKCKTFEDFMKVYKSMIDKSIGKVSTTMKLVGRNNNGSVYATLPNCVGIAQANTQERANSNGVNVGDWYTWAVYPFGNNLSFSSYEATQKSNYENAKPTPMPSSDLGIDSLSKDDEDIDFESLL